ncbi:hypothetical protein RF11_01925 [Thelohanellus kitauei]|uniref:Uncharacterized protein n=1 Tax=Thelohanellus kitauei TaxID=669202 RepID=A0A0C2JBX5_THEKT|nr:hypothetical protein RF11_01925 [Thelohanellus kitauei]
MNVIAVWLLIKCDETYIIDFPSLKSTHRIEFEGVAMAQCKTNDFLKPTHNQTVNITTFLSKWVDKSLTISFFFDLETSTNEYFFTNIGVDMIVSDTDYVLIKDTRTNTDKFQYNYRNYNKYYLTKPVAPSGNKTVYWIVGVSITILLIISIINFVYIIQKNKVNTRGFQAVHTISSES